MTDRDQLIDLLVAHLQSERECGRRTLAFDGKFPSLPPAAQPRAAQPRPIARPSPAPTRPPAVPVGGAGAAGFAPAQHAASDATPAATDAQTHLARIAAAIAACERCALAASRTRTVPGQGHPRPEILFVGEGPGADEDRQGLAFVGPAGQLLTQMIAAMGFARDEVFIANVVKCRPPGNRSPEAGEMASCLPFLRQQIEVLAPKVIVCLGNVAAQGLLCATMGITRLRGRWLTFGAIPVMPTYHPAYLLRFPAAKRQVWEDLKTVMRHLGKPLPERKQS